MIINLFDAKAFSPYINNATIWKNARRKCVKDMTEEVRHIMNEKKCDVRLCIYLFIYLFIRYVIRKSLMLMLNI